MAVYRGPGTSALLLRALERFPDRVALRWDDGHLSYRAVADCIGRMQAVLLGAGLKQGDRVAMLAGNSASGWCASMAAQACGMGVSWLNALGSLDDHLFQLQDFGAAVLIADTRAHADRVAELGSRLDRGLRIYGLGGAELGEDLAALAERAGHHRMRDLSSFDDLALVNYTGGTTGRGKGVLRDQHNLAEVSRSVLSTFELPDRPSYLAVAPISHVAGTLMLPVLMKGGTVRLMDRFVLDKVYQTLKDEHVAMALLVPTMIYSLLDHAPLAPNALPALRTVLYGASPMTAARLEEGLQRLGPVFAQLYGQTEAYPLTYLARDDHDLGRPELLSSCGVASPATRITLLGDDDEPVAEGECGEICVQGPHVMQGYHDRPDLTREALRGGWLRTGDMARRDERGYFWIVDRKKDMVVSGGFNVYPREVEDALASDPAVAEVAVIGVPDPRWGEAVVAVVVCRPGVEIERAALSERLIQRVKAGKGAVHAPKRVEFVEELPRTPVGKIDKKALRQPYWAGQARQVG